MIKAELFDVAGFILFIILLILGISIIRTEELISALIITISIMGLLADGYSILTNFILKLK
ncbi:MAG TPA: hypothetical protein VMC80_01470 [Patescibacteria group bacterium]|nr:hypothetical protein [Patescibacteria group bacterium]